MKRFLKAYDIAYAEADRIAGVPTGKTFSFVSGRSKQIKASYLIPLAENRGIPVEWFFDGLNDYPDARAGTTGDNVPVISSLPIVDGKSFPIVRSSARPAIAPPDRSVFYHLAESLGQSLKAGDLILVTPSPIALTGQICLVAKEASKAIAECVGEGKFKQLGSDDLAADGVVPEGVVVEIIRSSGGNVQRSISCPSGLTGEILSTF